MSLTLIAIAATAIVAAAIVWARRREAFAAAHRVFCCPGCAQKVRYPADKAGCACVCPRCRRRWVLPTCTRQSSPARHSETGTAENRVRLRWRPTRLAGAGSAACRP
jgi:hypothetical protein